MKKRLLSLLVVLTLLISILPVTVSAAARNAYDSANKISTALPDAYDRLSVGDNYIGSVYPGYYARYDNVDFGVLKASKVYVDVGLPEGGISGQPGIIEVRVADDPSVPYSNATVIANIQSVKHGSWTSPGPSLVGTIPVSLRDKCTGTKTIYIGNSGSGAILGNVFSFYFDYSPVENHVLNVLKNDGTPSGTSPAVMEE